MNLKKRKRTCLQKVCWVCSILVSPQIVSAIGSERSKDNIKSKYICYLRFGHIKEDRINKLKWYELLGSSTLESFLVCKFYFQRKMAKLSFAGHEMRTIEILILVHVDVYSPFDVQGRSGYLYFIIFINNFSHY